MLAYDTHLPADSVEFCPFPTAQDVLVCGTYQLIDSPSQPSRSQTRRGHCLVLKLDQDSVNANRTLHQIQSIPLPAVLDIKWSHGSTASNPILAIADAEGNVRFYFWETCEGVLKQLQVVPCAESDILCLSIDWSDRRSQGS